MHKLRGALLTALLACGPAAETQEIRPYPREICEYVWSVLKGVETRETREELEKLCPTVLSDLSKPA